MASRSLNKVILIGNLTRDPELRYTPAGTAVCTLGLATNRSWTTQNGDIKEETEFHRIVAWNKLAELCAQLLAKGRKIYVEGRLATHSWTGQDGNQRSTTEIVIEDMIILDSKRQVREGEVSDEASALSQPTGSITAKVPVQSPTVGSPGDTDETKKPKKGPKSSSPGKVEKEAVVSGKGDQSFKESGPTEKKEQTVNEDITPDDIPF